MVRVPPPGDRSFFVVSAESAQHPPHVQIRARSLATSARKAARPGRIRLAALGLLGVSVGIGGAVGGIALVQANDSSDMYATVRHDEKVRAARRAAAPQIVYNSYAPARPSPVQPLARMDGRGMVAFPSFDLNPFIPGNVRPEGRRGGAARTGGAPGLVAGETVSGAGNVARSICVRLCDGYQHPLAHLNDSGDLRGHEALCRATFPGVPTRVFRVAAGAETIDDAVGPDGRTYRSLPMAYAYQTSIDPACARPRTGADTISILKDFTLRAGDAVVINGRPKVFTGSSSYPYTAANFRDFRNASQIGETQRRQIDEIVGVSRHERLKREVQRMSRVREASAQQPNRAVDIVRGGPAAANPGVRIIEIKPR
jgi:hypothetical protein